MAEGVGKSQGGLLMQSRWTIPFFVFNFFFLFGLGKKQYLDWMVAYTRLALIRPWAVFWYSH